MKKALAKKDMISKVLRATGDKFREWVTELGYMEFDYEIIDTPRITNRGLLRARGSFIGPRPYHDDDRPVEDECKFTLFITEDTVYKNLLVIDVKLDGAIIAQFKILPDGIYRLDGELPHA